MANVLLIIRYYNQESEIVKSFILFYKYSIYCSRLSQKSEIYAGKIKKIKMHIKYFLKFDLFYLIYVITLNNIESSIEYLTQYYFMYS